MPEVLTSLAESVPGRLYLLACGPERNRQCGRPEFGALLRGAVIAELNLRGLLVADETNRGRVRAAGNRRTGDPVLDEVLRQVEESRPRGWAGWLRRGQRRVTRKVRDRLAELEVIRVEQGLLRRRVFLADPAAVAALRDSVRTIALGDEPVSRVAVPDAVLVTLLATGQLALSRREIRQHKARLAELAERGGELVPALRQAVKRARSARMAAYGS